MLPDFRLDGKVALVTGASEGIGWSIARAFADAGAALCLVARRQQILDAAVEALGRGSVRVVGVCGSVADSAVREESVSRCRKELGGLDILVNNAGIGSSARPVLDMDEEAMDRTYGLNLKTPVLYSQLAWRTGMQAEGGSIINITSFSGLKHLRGHGWYGATKAALDFLTLQLALELAPGVRVNAIAPGSVATPMLMRNTTEEQRERMARRPLQRMGRGEDIAGAALYLASEAASFVTGQVIAVEGGALLG